MFDHILNDFLAIREYDHHEVVILLVIEDYLLINLLQDVGNPLKNQIVQHEYL
jgi:hypothetical protein